MKWGHWKSRYIRDLHYLVLFAIHTILGTTLIETVLTGDPLYHKTSHTWIICQYVTLTKLPLTTMQGGRRNTSVQSLVMKAVMLEWGLLWPMRLVTISECSMILTNDMAVVETLAITRDSWAMDLKYTNGLNAASKILLQNTRWIKKIGVCLVMIFIFTSK